MYFWQIDDWQPLRIHMNLSKLARGHTIATLVSAANATMSAHDTMPGQTSSTWAFAVSITAKPWRVWLGIASFSDGESIRTDASQPCLINSPATEGKFANVSTSSIHLMIRLTITYVSKGYILKACSSLMRPLVKGAITRGSPNSVATCTNLNCNFSEHVH